MEQRQKWWHDSMSGSAQRDEDEDLDFKHQKGKAEADRLLAVDEVILRAREQTVRDAQTKQLKINRTTLISIVR